MTPEQWVLVREAVDDRLGDVLRGLKRPGKPHLLAGCRCKACESWTIQAGLQHLDEVWRKHGWMP